MDIHLIVAKFDDEPEILDAWTEWMIDGNPTGFETVLKEFKEQHMTTDVRTAIVEVPDNFFEQVFADPKVKGRLKGTGG